MVTINLVETYELNFDTMPMAPVFKNAMNLRSGMSGLSLDAILTQCVEACKNDGVDVEFLKHEASWDNATAKTMLGLLSHPEMHIPFQNGAYIVDMYHGHPQLPFSDSLNAQITDWANNNGHQLTDGIRIFMDTAVNHAGVPAEIMADPANWDETNAQMLMDMILQAEADAQAAADAAAAAPTFATFDFHGHEVTVSLTDLPFNRWIEEGMKMWMMMNGKTDIVDAIIEMMDRAVTDMGISEANVAAFANAGFPDDQVGLGLLKLAGHPVFEVSCGVGKFEYPFGMPPFSQKLSDNILGYMGSVGVDLNNIQPINECEAIEAILATLIGYGVPADYLRDPAIWGNHELDINNALNTMGYPCTL